MSAEAETVVRAAQHALIHGGQFLETLPKMVLKIGKGRLWNKLKPRGRDPFAEFSDFATHPLPDGLGCDIGRLIDLCKGHDKAVKFLEAQRGREQKKTKQGERFDLEPNAVGMKLTFSPRTRGRQASTPPAAARAPTATHRPPKKLLVEALSAPSLTTIRCCSPH